MAFINDTFTEASNTELSLHSPEQGGSWIEHPSYPSGEFLVEAGTGYAKAATAAASLYYNDAAPPSADQRATAVFKNPTSWAGVVVRASTSQRTFYTAFAYQNNKLFLSKEVASTLTHLASKDYTFAADTDYTLELEVSGSSLSVKINGVTELTATDGSITAAGKVGVYGQNSWISSFTATDVAAVEGITLTDITNLRIFQRSGTSASIAVSGTYTGSPTAIEARIVEDGTSTEVVPWTTIDAAPSGGAFSGAISVPQGGWYNVQVRYANDTGIVDNGTSKFGVGALICCAGQSNSQQMFTIGTGTPNSTTSKYNGSWATNTGAGSIAFANALNTALGIPVGMIDTGVSGAALTAEGDRGSGYWLNLAGTPWTGWTTDIAAIGGKLEAILWSQGESDALEGVTKTNYASGLTTLFDRMRTELDQASIPIFLSPLTRTSDGTATDANWNAINDAILEADTSTELVDVDTWDLSMADTYHFDATGYANLGTRFSLAVRRYLGETSVYGYGPSVASVVKSSDTTLDINLSHAGGTDFTPTTGITGFRFTDDGSVITPSSVVRQSASVIRATFGAAFIGTVVAAVAYGKSPTITGAPKDNSSSALPVRRTLSAGIATGITLAGTHQAAPSATAALTVDLPMAGAAVSVANATAALSAQIPLDGAVTAQVMTDGTIALDMALSVAAIAQALSQADMVMSQVLGASMQAQPSASADIDLGGTDLSGTPFAQVAALGTINVTVALAGSDIAQAVAQADLNTGGVDFSGSAVANPVAAGDIVMDVPITGNAQAQVTGLGNVVQLVPVASSSASVVSMNGQVLVSMQLDAVAIAQALSLADLSVATDYGLSGDARAQTNANAALNMSLSLASDAIVQASVAGLLDASSGLPIRSDFMVTAPPLELMISA